MSIDIGVLPKPVPFGKYCLLEKISVGGMAEVFKAKAFGAEGFERLLAVKRILNSIAEDETFISMFIDEAKIAGQLNHPNIAQIFDLGKVDGSYFIALEYVSGKDLRTIWDRMVNTNAKPNVFMAVYATMKACAALYYAHTKTNASGSPLNIVHRDVSPHNILVSYEGDAKIIDFGIAKAQGKTSETQVGTLKGKFSYMAPEQVRGLHVDHRADIFSLGIVLYEMLTLERLFLGESDFDTLEKIRKVEMAPPTLYNPHIPRELEDIVLKSLAKSADERFQTASEMYDALDRFLRNQGSYFQAKELAQVMKELFADEIEMERKKLDHYRTISVDSLKGQATGVEDEDLDTRVYGRNSSSSYESISPVSDVGGKREPALPDIVYKAPKVNELLDVDELDSGFDDLDDPTMEFNRDEHLADLADLQPTPEPKLDPKPAPLPGPVPLEQSSPWGASTSTSVSPPQPRKKREPLIPFLIVLILLLICGIFVFPQFLKGDTALIFKVSNAKTVKIAIDDKVVYSGAVDTQGVTVSDISPGKRSIAVSADGYKTLVDSVDVQSGTQYNLPIKLEKAPVLSKTAVSVQVTPIDAEVTIDGVKVATPSPFKQMLLAGKHELSFSKAGFLKASRQIDVKDGEVIQIAVTLKPLQVALNIRAQPAEAAVTIFEFDPNTKQRVKVKSGTGTLDISGLDATKQFKIIATLEGHDAFEQDFMPGVEPSTSLVARLIPRNDIKPDKVPVDDPNKLAKLEEARKKREEAARKRSEEEARKKEEARKRAEANKGKETPKPEKTGPAFLNIMSKPAAQVLVDGSNIGWTPVINHKVSSGSHSVVLVNDKNGLRKTYRVNLKPGQTRSLLNIPPKSPK